MKHLRNLFFVISAIPMLLTGCGGSSNNENENLKLEIWTPFGQVVQDEFMGVLNDIVSQHDSIKEVCSVKRAISRPPKWQSRHPSPDTWSSPRSTPTMPPAP